MNEEKTQFSDNVALLKVCVIVFIVNAVNSVGGYTT